MKTLLNTLLIATMTCSFAVAQRYDTAQLPKADNGSRHEPLVVVKDEAQNPAEPKEGAIQQADVTSESEPKYDAVQMRGPGADALLGVKFWGYREDNLVLKAETNEPDSKFVCLVIASLEDSMMSIPGLPPLLATDTVVATSIGIGAFAFDMGPAKLPFTVFAQAVVLDAGRAASSNVLKIEAAL